MIMLIQNDRISEEQKDNISKEGTEIKPKGKLFYWINLNGL